MAQTAPPAGLRLSRKRCVRTARRRVTAGAKAPLFACISGEPPPPPALALLVPRRRTKKVVPALSRRRRVSGLSRQPPRVVCAERASFCLLSAVPSCCNTGLCRARDLPLLRVLGICVGPERDPVVKPLRHLHARDKHRKRFKRVHRKGQERCACGSHRARERCASDLYGWARTVSPAASTIFIHSSCDLSPRVRERSRACRPRRHGEVTRRRRMRRVGVRGHLGERAHNTEEVLPRDLPQKSQRRQRRGKMRVSMFRDGPE